MDLNNIQQQIELCEIAIVYKAINNPREFKNLVFQGKFTPEFLSLQKCMIMRHILTYYKKFSELPSVSSINEWMQANNITLSFEKHKYTEAILYYWELFLKLKFTNEWLTFMGNIDIDNITQDNSMQFAENVISNSNQLLQLYNPTVQLPKTLSDLYPEVLHDMDIIKNGTRVGVKIPFQHLEDTIGVWGPGELSACIARTNVGKTWWTIINAIAAAEQGYKVLYASKEMLSMKLGKRLLSVGSKLDYGKFTKATLSVDEMLILDNWVNDNNELAKNIIVCDPRTIDRPEDIELYIKKFNPFFVVVDAFYMFQNVSGDKQWEKVSNLLKLFKNMTTKNEVHIQLTSQFNKSGKNRKSSNEFAVAFSDAINQDSDYRIDLFQNNTLAKLDQIEMTIGKGRDSKRGATMIYNWNFTKMDFSSTGYVVEVVDDDENPFNMA
jgi:hypothetical protein